MSGKKNDILAPLESLIDEGRQESVSKIIALLEGHRPKIIIDTEYQKSLKKNLLSQKKSPFSFSFSTHWFTFISSIWAITTCFVAAFGLYTLWIESTPWVIYSSWVSQVNLSSMMYSEEKAEKFTWDVSVGEDTTWELLWRSETSNVKISISPRAFQAEKSSIDKEVSEIQDDIMGTDSSDSREPSLDISELKAISSFNHITESSTESLPIAGTRDNFHSTMAISPSMALSQSLESNSAITYPSIMNIYMKATPWTGQEIENHSWSGVTKNEVNTEKVWVIEKKLLSVSQWRKILTQKIVYVPRQKLWNEKTGLYYLIPTIEFSLDSWEQITLPLMRWYK